MYTKTMWIKMTQTRRKLRLRYKRIPENRNNYKYYPAGIHYVRADPIPLSLCEFICNAVRYCYRSLSITFVAQYRINTTFDNRCYTISSASLRDLVYTISDLFNHFFVMAKRHLLLYVTCCTATMDPIPSTRMQFTYGSYSILH